VRIIFSLFILIASLFTFSPANASEPVSQPASQPITAPTAQLTYDSPTVTTSPAPAPTPAPQVTLPTIPAPEVGVRCEEDMPCWTGSPNDDRALPAQPARCEEDMPCWVGSPNDDRVYDSPEELDAWISYASLSLPEDAHEGLTMDYIKTVTTEPNSDSLDLSEFAIPSTTSTAWHVFRYVPLFTA
jgi:hypothetical protein